MTASTAASSTDAGAFGTLSDADLKELVALADPAVLRIATLHATRDPRLAAIEPRVTPGGGSDRVAPPRIEDESDLQLVREVAVDYLMRLRQGLAALPGPPSREEFHSQLESFLGHEIKSDEVEFWWEEFGVEAMPRAKSLAEVPESRREDFNVLVVGAGMNGIAAAIYLQAAGVQYVVAEKNAGVGGTWFNNVYPGARVDVASRAYSYTFEPDYPWPSVYATQQELLAYFEHCVDKYEIRDSIRFQTEVTSARWLEDDQMWLVELATPAGTEELRVNLIISAVGLFSQPLWPQIAGLDDFEGRLVHTAQWDIETADLVGKRVAVIGTGSSGVQLVGPLSELVGSLTVYQRAGAWIANVPDYRDQVSSGQQWLLDHFPYYVNWARLVQIYAIGDTRTAMLDVDPEWTDPLTVNARNRDLRDNLVGYVSAKLASRPELIAECIPNYPPLAKRLPKDNGWYDAMVKDHVSLVSEPIDSIVASGIRSASGEVREFDIIVLATGFDANNYLGTLPLVGRDGATLADAWEKDGARAYMGMCIPGFPNLFCLYGPNTNGKSGSPCSWGEMQVRYIIGCLKHLMLTDGHSMEVRRDVFDRFNAFLDERLRGLIWMDQRQKSYYRNEFNRVATNGAWLNREYWAWTLEPDPADFVERWEPAGRQRSDRPVERA